MVDNYLYGNKLVVDKNIELQCERYQLMGKQLKVKIKLDKPIEVLNIGKRSLIFIHNNSEYIYYSNNIEKFIETSFKPKPPKKR